jgi:ubiquinone/menaquinone biosynthesis C-methylase UbiE
MRQHCEGFEPESFKSPEQLPNSEEESRRWQEANRQFWESKPMRYDWNQSVEQCEFTRSFYDEVDRRFFSNVFEYMPWKRIPFDTLIDFEKLASKNILEIGVGMGSHAQLLATHAGSYTGIDITDYSVKATKERLDLYNIQAEICKMDAEHMLFPDSKFDFVWSWGVIHHSSNTRQILREMHRVLKPGGEAVVMVYHRGWWNYYICGGLIHGVIRGGLLKKGSLHKSIQDNTDGALARYYSLDGWFSLVQEYFAADYVIVKGSKAEVFPIPGGRIKNVVMGLVPSKITRFLTNQCKMGSFLISKLVKEQ